MRYGQNCKGGKCRSGKIGRGSTGGKCGSKLYGTQNRDYTLCLKKTAPLRQVGINSVIFQLQKNLKYTFCRE